MIQTIFTPLPRPKNLAGGETLIATCANSQKPSGKRAGGHRRERRPLIAAAIKTGIDGIFHAVQHAQAIC